MNLFEYITKRLSSTKENLKSPGLYCPNCWGRQEYGGNLFKALKTEDINTNNIKDKKGWVQAYAEKNLTGIQLNSQDSKLICNNCQTVYQKQ